MVADSFHQRITQSLIKRKVTPLLCFSLFCFGSFLIFYLFGISHQPLGGIVASVQHGIFHQFFYIRRDIFIDNRFDGIHNSHIHACLDGMIQKDRMHHLPDEVVAAEGEGKVAHAAAHLGMRKMFLDPAGCLNILHAVVLVFIDPRGNGQHVRVEDDVFGIESVFCEQPVGSFAYFDASFIGSCLSRLIEGHHHHRGTIALCQPGLMQKFRFAVFQGNGVDNRLALHTFQSRFKYFPF